MDVIESVREYGSHAETPRTHHVPPAIARLVSRVPTRLALAPHQRSVSRLAFGNYAATNPRGCGDSILRALLRAFPGHSRAGCGAAGGSVAPVVRARLLQPRAQSAACRAGNRREARRNFPSPEERCARA